MPANYAYIFCLEAPELNRIFTVNMDQMINGEYTYSGENSTDLLFLYQNGDYRWKINYEDGVQLLAMETRCINSENWIDVEKFLYIECIAGKSDEYPTNPPTLSPTDVTAKR